MTKRKHEKHYLRSDGDGGLNISHSVAIISIIIMLLLAIIPAAVAWGVIQAKVDNYQDVEIKTDINRENIAVITERVTNINDDVSEIKDDVKLIIEKLI